MYPFSLEDLVRYVDLSIFLSIHLSIDYYYRHYCYYLCFHPLSAIAILSPALQQIGGYYADGNESNVGQFVCSIWIATIRFRTTPSEKEFRLLLYYESRVWTISCIIPQRIYIRYSWSDLFSSFLLHFFHTVLLMHHLICPNTQILLCSIIHPQGILPQQVYLTRQILLL